MGRLSINELKARFATSDQPTQKDFADLIDTLLANITSATVNPGQAYFYATATLVGSSFVASYLPAVTSYFDGTILAFKSLNTNAISPAGPVLFDAGAGSYEVVKEFNVPLALGDIQPSQIVEVRFDTFLNKWHVLSRLTRDGGKAGDIVASATDLDADTATRLPCNGGNYLRADYPRLFAAIGTKFGSVDGSHFNVPDLRGRVLVHPGTLLPSTRVMAWADTLGEDKHQLILAELPSHNHSDGVHYYMLRPPYVGSLTGSDTVNSGSEQAVGGGDGSAIVTQGSNTRHENMPPVMALYYYILT